MVTFRLDGESLKELMEIHNMPQGKASPTKTLEWVIKNQRCALSAPNSAPSALVSAPFSAPNSAPNAPSLQGIGALVPKWYTSYIPGYITCPKCKDPVQKPENIKCDQCGYTPPDRPYTAEETAACKTLKNIRDSSPTNF